MYAIITNLVQVNVHMCVYMMDSYTYEHFDGYKEVNKPI